MPESDVVVGGEFITHFATRRVTPPEPSIGPNSPGLVDEGDLVYNASGESVAGLISLSAVRQIPGSQVSLTVKPAARYRLKAGSPRVIIAGNVWPLNGTGNFRTFIMPDYDVDDIEAEFERVYPVRSGMEGVTVIQKEAPAGDYVEFVINPPAGSILVGDTYLRVNGQPDAASFYCPAGGPYRYYVPNLPPDNFEAVITAVFSQLNPNEYQVIITPAANGYISAVPAHGPGGTVTVKAKGAPGYRLKAGSLKANGSPVSMSAGVETGGYIESTGTITLDGNKRISAEFERAPAVNVVFSGYTEEWFDLRQGGQSLSPAGGSFTVTVSPGPGREVIMWRLDGVDITARIPNLNSVVFSAQKIMDYTAGPLPAPGEHVAVAVAGPASGTDADGHYTKTVYFTVTD